ncbi:MAG TPA: GNAT family N-acetyltransferase [Geminicoccaceae bacterium]|nr:GNAT family N-acetyltransferase [Geminicoccaceae bacterium]
MGRGVNLDETQSVNRCGRLSVGPFEPARDWPEKKASGFRNGFIRRAFYGTGRKGHSAGPARGAAGGPERTGSAGFSATGTETEPMIRGAAAPTVAASQHVPPSQSPTSSRSIFHEDWWLDAVAEGCWARTVVSSGGREVGSLPYQVRKAGLFRVSAMPPFTHTLGPEIDVGPGKPQTQLENYLSICNDLIQQLPRMDHFSQSLDPAVTNVLSFQSHGFAVGVQQTLRIDCRGDADRTWKGLRDKTRNIIRRAEERLGTRTVEDPEEFARFYTGNLGVENQTSYYDFDVFGKLYRACAERSRGMIMAAHDPEGRTHAATFIVFDARHAYYLLSTRDKSVADLGATSLLLWHALKEAHARRLVFDLDGVTSTSRLKFLTGFGGTIATRFQVERSSLGFKLRLVPRAARRAVWPVREPWF